MGEVDNIMVCDWWWDEIEYGVPTKARLKGERQAYEEAEREKRKDELIRNRTRDYELYR